MSRSKVFSVFRPNEQSVLLSYLLETSFKNALKKKIIMNYCSFTHYELIKQNNDVGQFIIKNYSSFQNY